MAVLNSLNKASLGNKTQFLPNRPLMDIRHFIGNNTTGFVAIGSDGSSYSNTSESNATVEKFDKNGRLVWLAQTGGGTPYSIKLSADEKYVFPHDYYSSYWQNYKYDTTTGQKYGMIYTNTAGQYPVVNPYAPDEFYNISGSTMYKYLWDGGGSTPNLQCWSYTFGTGAVWDKLNITFTDATTMVICGVGNTSPYTATTIYLNTTTGSVIKTLSYSQTSSSFQTAQTSVATMVDMNKDSYFVDNGGNVIKINYTTGNVEWISTVTKPNGVEKTTWTLYPFMGAKYKAGCHIVGYYQGSLVAVPYFTLMYIDGSGNIGWSVPFPSSTAAIQAGKADQSQIAFSSNGSYLLVGGIVYDQI